LVNQIIAVLAGRAAEYEFFKKTSTGAYDDLQKAYRIARAIVTRLGMNPEIGQATFVENEYGVKEYSDAMNRKIDVEVGKILTKCTETAAEMVKEHRQLIRKMSDALLEKETLDLKAIQAVLGERPFPPESVFKAYLEEATAN
jgi:AFG3 family protein